MYDMQVPEVCLKCVCVWQRGQGGDGGVTRSAVLSSSREHHSGATFGSLTRFPGSAEYIKEMSSVFCFHSYGPLCLRIVGYYPQG